MNLPNGAVRLVRILAAHVLPPLLALVLLLAFWEFYVKWRHVHIIVLPAPSDAVSRFFDDPWFFWRQGGQTVYEATLGLFLGSAVAMVLAVLMAHSRMMERALFPLALLIKVTPLVAVVPILVIVFGFGSEPKILVAALFCFFPMLVNGMTGFRDVNGNALQFFRSLQASQWQVFWKLRAPSAMPYLFTGLKVAYPLALTGAVVAEYFTGDNGLGVTIFRANGRLDTPTVFASVGVLMITGVTINVLISIVERRVLFWHDSVRSTE